MITKTAVLDVLKALSACSTRNSLERVFKKYDVSMEQRIKVLKKAMGNPVLSYTSGYPSLENRYEIAVGAYLSGVWKKDYSSFFNCCPIKNNFSQKPI